MLLLVVLLLVFGYFYSKYRTHKIKYKDVNKLPGPKGYPIIGNAFDFGSNIIEFYENMKKMNNTYGPSLFKFSLGFTPNVVLCKAEYVENILNSSIHLDKSPAYDLFSIWLGEGLIISKAKKWKARRRMLTPTFHFKILEDFVPVFERCCDVLLKKLERIGPKEIDAYPIIKHYALDVICETSMGITVNAQTTANIPYMKSLKGFLDCHMKRFFSVIKRNEYMVMLTSTYWTQKKHVKVLHNFVFDAIRERRNERKTIMEPSTSIENDDIGIKRRKVFLDCLLDMAEQNSFTDDDIREEVDNFMFAGHDTISAMLSQIFHNLAKYPEMQKKIREEIASVIDSEIKFQDLSQLKYLECFVKESMRMDNVIQFIERELFEDAVIDGVTIPAHTTVDIMMDYIHHSEEYWENPYKFDPDRFLPDNCVSRHPYAYIPFSAGPRNCIGQRYAMLLIKFSIAKVLSNFEIELRSKTELIRGYGAVVTFPDGLFMAFNKLK